MPKKIQIDRQHPEPKQIEKARQVLAAGGLVIVPTETVYGLACDPVVPGSLQRLVSAKGRDGNKPIARLAASTKQVQMLAINWNDGLKRLAESCWPGPLTIILETAEGFTGFRVPDHAVPLALATACGHSLALTSANQSGGTAPKTADEAVAAVTADLTLDAGAASEKAIPSTVIKVAGERLECLREGALPFSTIQTIFRKEQP